MYNSPLANRLRSKKNHKVSEPSILPKKNKKIASVPLDLDLDLLINQKCSNIEEEEFLFRIELNEDDVHKETQNPSNKNFDLITEFNNLALNSNDDSWELLTSQKGGYKLYSLGFGYFVDRPKRELVATAKTVYWKCDKSKEFKSTGRGVTTGLNPPFKMTQPHLSSHFPTPVDKERNKYLNNFKKNAQSSKDAPRHYPKELESLIEYIANNYIRNKNGKARFSIDLWNVHERVKLNLPRTNNNVESWHSRIKPDARNSLTIDKVVELFREEQSNMESDLAQVLGGQVLKTSTQRQIKNDNCIRRLVESYDLERIELFIDGMCEALNL
ncbi:hypothetical protein BpHYR1_014524 [Brachionus plicatilis]|uniref:Uncharacterized protein n=1 Tax=Brachionus plicatilis TaxID=10195 RepID=A0A3M7QBJ3_BRAPC|nr:hypothetical protein BpHYR1_014524 [Brachionus plicatilis]